MKILVLYYSPWWNATAYYAITLAQGFQRAGHSVLFGTDNNAHAGKIAQERGLTVFDIKLQTVNPIRALFEIWRLVRFIKHEKIDIVNTLSPQGHLFHFISKKFFGLNVPLVRICCDERKPKGHWLNKYLYNRCVNWLIFPCKSNFERYYEILRFPPQNTSIVYGAIDLNDYDHNKPAPMLRETYSIGTDVPVVGIVARLSPEKGHRHFLHMAAKVVSRIKNIRFVIVGKEEQISIESLRELAVHLGIGDKVVFTGYLDDPRAVIDEITIGVLSSRFSETISRTALEYMASAKPVITTNVNALSEIIRPDRTGKVYDIDDVIGMANGIIELLNDSSKCREWGENGRKEVEEKYTIEKSAEETLRIFKRILSQKEYRG